MKRKIMLIMYVMLNRLTGSETLSSRQLFLRARSYNLYFALSAGARKAGKVVV